VFEDAGPAVYDDAAYGFGANIRFNNAGMDVSSVLNGCLGFAELSDQNDRSTGSS